MPISIFRNTAIDHQAIARLEDVTTDCDRVQHRRGSAPQHTNLDECRETFLLPARFRSMDDRDGRAMFELLLELHCRAKGIRPIISADEILELRHWLQKHTGDLRDIAGPTS